MTSFLRLTLPLCSTLCQQLSKAQVTEPFQGMNNIHQSSYFIEELIVKPFPSIFPLTWAQYFYVCMSPFLIKVSKISLKFSFVCRKYQ